MRLKFRCRPPQTSASNESAAAATRAIAQRAAPHAVRRPDPVLVEEEASDNDEVLPSINEINLTGAQALPEMHLDVHVYATKPADRFVYHQYAQISRRQHAAGRAGRWSAFGAMAWCSTIRACVSYCRGNHSAGAAARRRSASPVMR